MKKMPFTDVLNHVLKAFEEILQIEVDAEELIHKLDLDDLDRAEIIVNLEAVFGITICPITCIDRERIETSEFFETLTDVRSFAFLVWTLLPKVSEENSWTEYLKERG